MTYFGTIVGSSEDLVHTFRILGQLETSTDRTTLAMLGAFDKKTAQRGTPEQCLEFLTEQKDGKGHLSCTWSSSLRNIH